MKKQYLYYLIFSIAFLSSCKKYDENPPLVTATQTGQNTVGCIIDGKIFSTSNELLSGNSVKCKYYPGGWFSLDATRQNLDRDNQPLYSLFISSPSLTLVEGRSYKLQDQNISGVASASYDIFQLSGDSYHNTNATVTGQLTITHLDPSKKILSGTFYFDAVGTVGAFVTKVDTIHVTDGRFDMIYLEH